MVTDAYHRPVLLEEVMGYFGKAVKGTYVDGTLGGAGHARAVLDANPGVRLIGLDKDPAALRAAAERLAGLEGRFRLMEAGYEEIPRIVRESEASGSLGGVFLDLGISSRQIDDPDKGFSFSQDGPLDMRFSSRGELTAETLVNDLPERELERIFFELGEEPRARAIVRAVAAARQAGRITRTRALARLIEGAAGSEVKIKARIFQALRIAVNSELGALDSALNDVPGLLAPGGRFAVIAYHSLEDRKVKHAFRARSEDPDRGSRLLPGETPAPRPVFTLLTKKPIRPTDAEAADNSRSRSARLRVAERL